MTYSDLLEVGMHIFKSGVNPELFFRPITPPSPPKFWRRPFRVYIVTEETVTAAEYLTILRYVDRLLVRAAQGVAA